MELLRPILELGVVIPGMLLAYFPAKSSLKQPLSKLVLWLVPLLALLCAAGGVVCYARRMPTAPMLAALTLLAVVIYIKTLRISLWKSGTIALSVCAVFACINSLCRAINAAMLAGLPQAQAAPWFCLRSAICYHAICWLFAAIAYYPATHSVRRMVEDDNFAQTWYVFWVLPLVFIALNLFMIPKYADTLYTGRVLQGYFVISITLLFLMLFFNAIFLLMAISINRNVRLQQENQLLSMQQQRYESLKAAIEEARQARHDLRHQLCQLAALAEEGDLEKIKAYLSGAVSRIPSLEMHFCENRAADSVVGYYCALAKRENIPYSVQIDLPECLPVDEINLCLVLSNLLENALEASLRTAPARRRIKLTAYLHGNSLALIQVENTYDGVIREKGGVFQSSKRKGDGVGLQSVRHIAEKSGGVSTVTYQDGVFRARVMLRGIKAERGNAGRRKQSWTLGDIGASTVRSAGGVGLRSPAGPRRLGTATRISASLSRRLSAFFKSASDQDPKAAKFAVLTPGHAGFPNVRNAPRVVIAAPSETPLFRRVSRLCAIL